MNTVRLSPAPVVERLLVHLREPLDRNGYALVISSALTSGLGVIFWMLAARIYSTEAIGLNSAALSTMSFLSYLAQLNMTNALNRFLPRAGQATTRLIVAAYGICATVAMLATIVFILGLDYWAPSLMMLRSSLGVSIGFIAATMLWCIFALQDGVLIGLRQSTWVPIENALFALAKLVILVLVAGFLPNYGVLVAWNLPLVFLVLVINLLIFRRLVPNNLRAAEGQAVSIQPKQIVSYVTGDYLSSIIWLAVTNLLPLIIIAQAGATANAHFYLAWTVAYSLYLVSRNMGMSLIAEAAADEDKLRTYAHQTLVQSTRLVAPAVVVLVIGAPFFLYFFGESYASEGTMLLRLLCLSALPNIVTSIYISIARVKRQVGMVVLLQTSISLLALGLSYLWLPRYGITGIGTAWLMSQGIVALVLALGGFRRFGAPPIMSLVLREAK
jgi:O-antigen/teichoic acid export membrane protein